MHELRTLEEIVLHDTQFRLDVAFDVGAHVGRVSSALRKFNPKKAKIHAFEPVPETFDLLKSEFSRDENIILNSFALSRMEGEAEFTIGRNTSNRFAIGQYEGLRKCKVQVSTGDN